MWWCCGKASREATGCKQMQHESKEEDEDIDQQEKLETEKIMLKGYQCPSCKQFGHKTYDCPKDPNLRGWQVYDFEEELIRIDKLKNQKKISIANFCETNQKVAEMLQNKIGKKCFGSQNISSDESEAEI